MAEQRSTAQTAQAPSVPVDKMSAARAARKANAKDLPQLSDRSKFLLANVQQAIRGCKLLAKQIREGGEVSPEVSQAAATLAGEASKCLN